MTETQVGSRGENLLGLQSWKAVQTLLDETANADRQDREESDVDGRLLHHSADIEDERSPHVDVGGTRLDMRYRQRTDSSDPSNNPHRSGYHTPTESPGSSSFLFGEPQLHNMTPPSASKQRPHYRTLDGIGFSRDRQSTRRIASKTSFLSIHSPLQKSVQRSGRTSVGFESISPPITSEFNHDQSSPTLAGPSSYFGSGRVVDDAAPSASLPIRTLSPEPLICESSAEVAIAGSQARSDGSRSSEKSGDDRPIALDTKGDGGVDAKSAGIGLENIVWCSDASDASGATIRPGPYLRTISATHGDTSEREGTIEKDKAFSSKADLHQGAANDAVSALYSAAHPPVWIRQVLKCSLAYLIASAFTFVPALSALLSTSSETDVHGRIIKKPAYSAHMVATVMVYFHPARSRGEMILASKFCVLLAALAAALCTLSILTMYTFDHFFPEQDSLGEEFGGWAVLVLWVGGGMGVLAWLKLKVGNPNFNTGCSMAAVTIFTVIVKEGGFDKLLEVLLIVIIGAAISNLVCFTLWPESATTQLEESIDNTFESFSTLLGLLSATFLLDRPPSKTTQASLDNAVKAHTNSFVKLKADLSSARHESAIDGRIGLAQQERFAMVIDSLTRLAQHLTGLRGGVVMQAELLRESSKAGEPFATPEQYRDRSTAVNDIFWDFRDAVGPSLRNLTSNCCTVLARSNNTLEDGSTNLAGMRMDLDRSLSIFRSASSEVVNGLFHRYSFLGSGLGEEGTVLHGDQGGPDSAAAAETLFLLYFFLFTFEEFARETLSLLADLQSLTGTTSPPSLKAWLKAKLQLRGRSGGNHRSSKKSFVKRLATIVPLDPSETQPPGFPSKQQDTGRIPAMPSPRGLSRNARFWQKIWAFQDRLRQPDITYAVKTGLGSIILAAPAFIERFRATFLEYRGEWALIAFFASMSPSIGQTNILSAYRVAGTLFGALVAVGAYSLFPDNPVALPIIGCFFSMPCFWIVTQRPQYQQASRFVLLTYNLTCLYAYNQRDTSLSAWEIGWRRSASVVAGVVWAGVVSAYWWPYAARKELRVGLSDFCIDLSYLFSKLVAAYSGQKDLTPPANAADHGPVVASETTALLGGDPASHSPVLKQFLSMELHLQIELIKLRGLLAQTFNEPRLKGPFPFATYDGILSSCQNILDKFHSMRCVTTRREWDAHIHESLVKPVNAQRREMVSNVLLYFYLLAAAFRLRTPLPPALPPAEKSRQRLVKAILQLNQAQSEPGTIQDERQWLYFAYALAMQGVIEELQYLGETLQDTFGIINQSTRGDFDALFV